MKVRCESGLCDRVTMIFSFLQKARRDGEKLIVRWPDTVQCNGHFLDVFCPVEDIEFTEDCSNLDHNSWRPCSGFEPWRRFIYDGLVWRPELRRAVDEMRSEMGRYLAIQVRRTDKVTYNGMKKLTPDEEFFNYIDKSGYESIFLATDNRESQDVFKDRYGDRLFWTSRIDHIEPEHIEQRHTSLTVAGVDLLTCILADDFKGTRLSGFSTFIGYFRNERKRKTNRIKLL